MPHSINDRLVNISSDVHQFNKVKQFYGERLKNAGYNHELKFEIKEKTASKKRNRNIIWFNPPFSQNVKTNIAKEFLKLIDKHFPSNNKFCKLFNRNNIKVSYCCMPNMENIIRKHNAKIMSNQSEAPISNCNCRDPPECPVNGNCLSSDMIYKATVVTDNDKKEYFGSCSTTFKIRYGNHKSSFKNAHKSNESELSNYIWQLKEQEKSYKINWDLITKAKSYSKGQKGCNLCFTEKLFILNGDKSKLLNKYDLMTKCLHKRKCKINKLL